MKYLFLSIASTVLLASCSGNKSSGQDSSVKTSTGVTDLPKPYDTKSSVNFSKVLGWPEGLTPKAPAGFTVTPFASGLNSPRWIYVAPNGDIFISEARTQRKGVKKVVAKVIGQASSLNENDQPSGNDIVLLRDTNNDGVADFSAVFLSNLNQPFGMLVIGNSFYVANTDGLWVYPYKAGITKMTEAGKKIVSLPAGGYNNHWTRNIITNKDQSKIYITVGSGSNVAEHGIANEVRRANILEVNPDGSGEVVYASGLRNPVGLAWATGTQTLWTAVNERDELGDNLVPDYLTSVKRDGFYGWPYSYWGQHPDPRMKGAGQEFVRKAIVPDVDLGSHTASLGLAFDTKMLLPKPFTGGAFIGQHGSWNRSELVGYKVVFVPFANGKPTGKPLDFLTGFRKDASKDEVYGRPVGVAITPKGFMLVADDAGNTIWCVRAVKTK
ncbi:sorbosone dehydrogenase family protein [Taibaiella lutea]|uniref:Sorbosone dehydrogenase family protein n=1 Tax=Taibaiella lutea TaxID=2608001 RepID=A0A5M6CL64_9BACT|nr:sorbosone dehydrogenase family protein [Taibaiella lutea]KAA5534722.1 sorbosone dehydrogenase family protein [Taibaiella lutea]